MGKEKFKFSFEGRDESKKGEVDFLLFLGLEEHSGLSPVVYVNGEINSMLLAMLFVWLEKKLVDQAPDFKECLRVVREGDDTNINYEMRLMELLL